MTIQEIEAAIIKLPHKDFWLLMNRLNELQSERWDQEIERDVAAGRFDALIEQAKKDVAAGLGRRI